MKSNTLSWSDPVSLQKIIEGLYKNKVVLAPSDTVWGLCGVPTREVFDKLDRLKVRNDKPYLLLAYGFEDVARYAYLPENENFLAMIRFFWPGPLTIILKARETAPEYMVSKEGSIAFRVPLHAGLQALLSQVPVLFSTSANISGESVPLTYAQVASSIKENVGLSIIPDRADEQQSMVPSTIVDMSKGALSLVRDGALPWQVLQEFLKNKS